MSTRFPFPRQFLANRCLLCLNLISTLTKSGFTQLSRGESSCINRKLVGRRYDTNTCQKSGGLESRKLPPGMALDIKPAPLGVEIRGIDLNEPVSEDLIKKFKEDVHKYRLLIFKNQGVISGDRHVEISRWFGELESTFYKHPRSPHPDVFRVSNDEREGCRNVGRTGWHIDGSFMAEPFGFALYHMASVPKIGNTDFVPLRELIESLGTEKRKRWERLWMVSDRRGSLYHPLIYPHPVTKQPTLCFHLGMTESFIWDLGTDQEREASQQETRQLLKEIHQEIVKDNRRLIYSHKWEVGDFIISDNLSVGHEATPQTQLPVTEVGLRVLHRTTVKGTNQPQK